MENMKFQYNSILPDNLISAYQSFFNLLPESQRNIYDYDMAGAFLDNLQSNNNGHFSDKFKKPNHPTFSNESIYNGVDNNFGGKWSTYNGKDAFYPSETNLKNMPIQELQRYFQMFEPDAVLIDALPSINPK